jgi:hypothetical protein
MQEWGFDKIARLLEFVLLQERAVAGGHDGSVAALKVPLPGL